MGHEALVVLEMMAVVAVLMGVTGWAIGTLFERTRWVKRWAKRKSREDNNRYETKFLTDMEDRLKLASFGCCSRPEPGGTIQFHKWSGLTYPLYQYHYPKPSYQPRSRVDQTYIDHLCRTNDDLKRKNMSLLGQVLEGKMEIKKPKKYVELEMTMFPARVTPREWCHIFTLGVHIGEEVVWTYSIPRMERWIVNTAKKRGLFPSTKAAETLVKLFATGNAKYETVISSDTIEVYYRQS